MRIPARMGWLLLAAGILRMALLVFGDPLAGQANNYDFVRFEACLGLWPEGPAEARTLAHVEAPIPNYVRGERLPGACQPSAAIVFPAAAMAAHAGWPGAAEPMPLKAVGGVALLCFALAGIAIAMALRGSPNAQLVHGLLFLAVAADPLVTLYFNSLYAETALFLGAWLLVGFLAAVSLRGYWSIRAALGIAAGALLIGFAKEQFFALPFVLLLAALPAVPRDRFLACALAVACVPVALLFAPVTDAERPYPAHRIDAYLGALVPSSADPDATMRRLGLPPRCAALAGGSWHRLRGEDYREACPEAVALPHWAFVPLAWTEPATLVRAGIAFVVQAQNAYSGYLGILAGRTLGEPKDLEAWRASWWRALFQETPPLVFVGFLAGMTAAFAFAGLVFWGGRSPAAHLARFLGAMALLVAYTLSTAVVGDGFADAGKHGALAAVALCGGIVALVAGLVVGGGRALPWMGASLVVALAIGAGTWAYARTLPLAFGVLDAPEGRRFEGPAPRVEGWALDPHGVARVEVAVGSKRVRADYGGVHPGLQPIFPAIPGSGGAQFSASLDPATLVPGTVVRILAVSRAGYEQEIDRRRVGP